MLIFFEEEDTVASPGTSLVPSSPGPMSPLARMVYGFDNVRLRSPIKAKYTIEEGHRLLLLIEQDDPILNLTKGLVDLLKTSPIKKTPNRTIPSIRSKIRDMKKAFWRL